MTDVQDIMAALKDVKPLYAAVSGVTTLLLGKSHVSPFEDDMPVPMKAILVCIAIAEIFLLDTARLLFGARWLIGWMAIAVLVFLIIYLWTYQMFGYEKIVGEPKKSWFWLTTKFRYKQVKILGGFWRTRAAKESDPRTTQDFLADCAYKQDEVWRRWSRVPVQIVAVLSYILLVVSLVGVLAIAVGI